MIQIYFYLCVMTIQEAGKELLEREDFKDECKHNAIYRNYKKRFLEGRIGNGSLIALLQKFGYTVDIKTKSTT